MTENLSERRGAVAADLAGLERQRGAALLDGTDFDANLITTKRGELEAIDAAASEAERREREAAAAEDRRRLEEIRQEAVGELGAFREAIADADNRAAALVESIRAIMDHGTRIAKASRALGIRTASDLDPMALESAISLAIGEKLTVLGRRPRALGYLTWPSSPTPQTFTGLARLVPDFDTEGSKQ